MDLEIGDQLSITLFPEPEGQPEIDVIKVTFTEVEGKKTSIFLTPDEAMELASGLITTVQFYLFNQEQYRKEILEPREKIAAQRVEEKDAPNAAPTASC